MFCSAFHDVVVHFQSCLVDEALYLGRLGLVTGAIAEGELEALHALLQ